MIMDKLKIVNYSKKLFEKFGFEYRKTIPSYWADENGFEYCIDCGQKPCICSAWEYVLKF